MKFILIVLSLVGQPQYSVGPFDSMDACQRYATPAETKRLCLITTSPRK